MASDENDTFEMIGMPGTCGVPFNKGDTENNVRMTLTCFAGADMVVLMLVTFNPSVVVDPETKAGISKPMVTCEPVMPCKAYPGDLNAMVLKPFVKFKPLVKSTKRNGTAKTEKLPSVAFNWTVNPWDCDGYKCQLPIV